MRPLSPLPLLMLTLLAGCAGPLPKPDPDMAWVELRAPGRDSFMAQRLDGRRLDDGRYFQVPPGKHRLEASYEYEVSGGGSIHNEPQFIRCRMDVTYDDFRAGERYLFEAHAMGFTPVVRLRGPDGEVIAEAERSLCL